ncbi:MAG: hypothetical protein MUO67_13305, partial [Anaerolineales bacterium]|nr:hypothetical protein [Anaerolineales bacterium]
TLPSRFLDDLPDKLIEGGKKTYPSRLSSYKEFSTPRWEVPAYRVQPKKKGPTETKYKKGMQVKHPLYGEGTVRISRLELGDETVEVYFEGGGLKALVASLANLEILD